MSDCLLDIDEDVDPVKEQIEACMLFIDQHTRNTAGGTNMVNDIYNLLHAREQRAKLRKFGLQASQALLDNLTVSPSALVNTLIHIRPALRGNYRYDHRFCAVVKGGK